VFLKEWGRGSVKWKANRREKRFDNMVIKRRYERVYAKTTELAHLYI